MRRVATCRRAVIVFATAWITLAFLAPSASGQSLEQRLSDLVKSYHAQQNAYDNARTAAKDDAERATAEKLRPDYAKVATELEVFAKQSEDKSSSSLAWLTLVDLAPSIPDLELMDEAVETLLRDHPSEGNLGYLLDRLYSVYAYDSALSSDAYADYVRKVSKRAEPGPAQARAYFALATELTKSARAGSPAQLDARELFAALAASYAQEKGTSETTYGERMQPWVYELEHLLPGHTAPEIEGKDLSGVAFKLSDYRGKVVLLDFWGNW
jgi:hypothetical protein